MKLDDFKFPAFETPEEAATFWRDGDARKFSQRTFFLLFGLFAFLTFGLLDFFAAGEHAATLLALRFAVSVPMAVMIMRFYTKQHSEDPDTLMCIFLASAGFAVIAMTVVVEGDAAATYPSGLVILLAYGGLVLTPRFSKLTATTVILCGGFWLSVPFSNISSGAMIVHAFFFSIGTFAIILGSFTRERLERLQAKADLRMVKINRSLKISRDEAVEAKRTQAQFIASMSHELRTPLNAINGFSELMMRELLGPMPDAYKEYSADINASGLNLLANIEDLLDIHRLNTGKISWEDARFALDEQVRLAIAMCQTHTTQAEVELNWVPSDFQPDIFGDKGRVTQAITNLITNAAKFTEAGGRIDVSVVPHEDGGLGISVSDTGIGISAVDLERIRNPFEQTEDGEKAKKYGGLGLGLSIVSGILEKMDSRLDITSELGVGTVATIVIPKVRVFAEDTAVRAQSA